VRKALTTFEMLRVPRDIGLARGMAVEPQAQPGARRGVS